MSKQEIFKEAYELLEAYTELISKNVDKLTQKELDLLLMRNKYIVKDLQKGLFS